MRIEEVIINGEVVPLYHDYCGSDYWMSQENLNKHIISYEDKYEDKIEGLLKPEHEEYIKSEIARLTAMDMFKDSYIFAKVADDMPEDMFKAIQESVSSEHNGLDIPRYFLPLWERYELARLIATLEEEKYDGEYSLWRAWVSHYLDAECEYEDEEGNMIEDRFGACLKDRQHCYLRGASKEVCPNG